MRKYTAILIVTLAIALSCARRIYVPIESVRTVTRTERDTVIDVKLQQIRDTVTMQARDTTSHIRNKYCESYATIHNGTFGHSLKTIEGASESGTSKVIEVIISDTIRVPVPMPVTKYVKNKTTLNEVYAWGFWIFIALFAIRFLILKKI